MSRRTIDQIKDDKWNVQKQDRSFTPKKNKGYQRQNDGYCKGSICMKEKNAMFRNIAPKGEDCPRCYLDAVGIDKPMIRYDTQFLTRYNF